MSKDQAAKSENREHGVEIGRRTILEKVALGGAALAVVGLVTITGAAAEQAKPESSPAGALQQVMSGRVRRVVTGYNADGKSKVVSDMIVDVAGDLWKTAGDQLLGPGPTGEPSYVRTLQTRFGIETLRPAQEPKPTLENRKGFHLTPGVTHIFVLNGTVTYLTDLEEVKLNAGDLIIQRNTPHSWRNDGAEPVKILVTLVQ